MDWNKHFAKVSRHHHQETSRFGAETAPAPVSGISVANVPGVSKLTPAQLVSLDNTARTLQIPLDWLATVISFETGGTFSPTIRNAAGSGAFGLIQFMPQTAQNLLGTATRDEAVQKGLAMSFDEQLRRMVIPYFKSYIGRMKSLNDVYLAIFYPAAISQPDDHIVGSAPSAVYTQNAGFDRDNKGYITRADITSRINAVLNNALGTRLAINTRIWPQVIAGIGLAAAMTYAVSVNTSLLPESLSLGKGKNT